MKLYHFPLSTYCQKTIMAFHEKEVTFTPELVDLRNEAERNDYLKLYPLGKVPLLVREDGWMIPESTIIIEYLDTHFDTGTRLIPDDAELARQVRFRDRMFDLYLNESVASLLFQSWKPEDERDQELIEKSHFRVGVMYKFIEDDMTNKEWAVGDFFSMADCAAAPALFCAQQVAPFVDRKVINQYWQRLNARSSWQKIMEEAAPYLEKLQAATA
ncbi:MAG: glutathione S-transferase family protein [Acidiferrobacterales bacterium]